MRSCAYGYSYASRPSPTLTHTYTRTHPHPPTLSLYDMTRMNILSTDSSNQPRDAKQRNNVYFVAVSNAFFSFISGFAIFSVAGYLAFESGTEVRDLPVGGFSLSFVTFPAAVSPPQLLQKLHFSLFPPSDTKVFACDDLQTKLALMPPGLSHFFSIIFFLFLILLGFDSSMALVEGVVASICDHVDFFSHRRGLATGLVCFVLFCLGIICTTPGGDAIMDIIDHFNSTYLVLLIGLAQCILWGFVYEFTPVPAHYAMLEDEQEHARKPIWQRVLLSTRLEREIERACGQSPTWLPFYWSVFIKWVSAIRDVRDALCSLPLTPPPFLSLFSLLSHMFLRCLLPRTLPQMRKGSSALSLS